MHGKLIIAALVGAALSAPAFAQGSGSTPGNQPQGSQSQGSQAQGSQAQGNQSTTQPQGGHGQARSQTQVVGQQQLRRQLEQAGFREVQVLDAAYLVQARTQDGNAVFMMINPPGARMQGAGMSSGHPSSATGSTGGTPGASGGSGSGGGSSMGSGSSATPSR